MSQHRVVGTLLAVGLLAALGVAVTPAEAWDGHHRHRHPRSAVILSFRFGVPLISPYYYYYSAPPPYVAYRPYVSVYPPVPPPPYVPGEPVYRSSYGQIRIEVEPGDVAITLNGQFIGLARDFHGGAIVTAERGEHLVELSLHGYTSRRSVWVEAGGQVFIQQNLGSAPPRVGSRSSAPFPSPGY